MFGLSLTFGFIWLLSFTFLAPDWLRLLSFVPLVAFGLHTMAPAYLPWCLLAVAPMVVIDIQTLPNGIKPKGIWRYLVWLPTVVLLFIIGNEISWHTFHLTLAHGWNLFISTFFVILLSRIWVSDPLILFINRLNITQVNEVTYHYKELQAKQSGRTINYHLVSNSLEELEISGMVFSYLKYKQLNADAEITFKFKQGWLGIIFSRGLPRIGGQSNNS